MLTLFCVPSTIIALALLSCCYGISFIRCFLSVLQTNAFQVRVSSLFQQISFENFIVVFLTEIFRRFCSFLFVFPGEVRRLKLDQTHHLATIGVFLSNNVLFLLPLGRLVKFFIVIGYFWIYEHFSS